ncbi:MAG TPA: hypothetical protein V6D10_05745 [Trichocoleus sp.]|jgi:hypothetical protein
MAFQSLVEVQGLSSSSGYWRVGLILIDTSDLSRIHIAVRVDGYASEEARLNGYFAIESIPYEFDLIPDNTGADEAQLMSRIKAWVYEKLTRMERWEGAPEV